MKDDLFNVFYSEPNGDVDLDFSHLCALYIIGKYFHLKYF